MSTFTIVRPNRCLICEEKKVPLEKRTILVLENQEICGSCGSTLCTNCTSFLGETTSAEATLQTVQSRFMLQRVLRSLVQHGVFQIDASPGSLTPIRLYREGDESHGLITCHLKAVPSSSHTPLQRTERRYKQTDIDSALPGSVRSACELLSEMHETNLDGSRAYMSFDSADVKRDRKTIRFLWSCRVDYDNGHRFNYEQVFVEIAWVEMDDAKPLGDGLLDAMDGGILNLAAEMIIQQDLVSLRAAIWEELTSKSPHKSVAIYTTINFEDPKKAGALYHPAAIDQVIKELDIIGLHAECQGPTMLGTSFLFIEPKKMTA